MSDTEPGRSPSRKFTFAIDMRDVLAGAGAVLIVAGAATIHWGLAVALVGAALVGLAWRLAKG